MARAFRHEVRGETTTTTSWSGTTQVTWTLNESPAGALILVWYEANQMLAIFDVLATSADDAASWMRRRTDEIGGIELTGHIQARRRTYSALRV